MYIENLNYKVKFKDHSVIYIMSGLWVNAYYDSGLANQIEFVEVIKNVD